jgi:hypothetical protein
MVHSIDPTTCSPPLTPADIVCVNKLVYLIVSFSIGISGLGIMIL